MRGVFLLFGDLAGCCRSDAMTLMTAIWGLVLMEKYDRE